LGCGQNPLVMTYKRFLHLTANLQDRASLNQLLMIPPFYRVWSKPVASAPSVLERGV
jgi:hypothetical protein